MQLTKNFTLCRKYGFRIWCHIYALGSFVFLNFASLVNMDVCQKTKCGNVSSATFIICDPRYKNRTYEAISNFEIGGKIKFLPNMASRSTVSLKPFSSKVCFMICQQDLVVERYYDSTTD